MMKNMGKIIGSLLLVAISVLMTFWVNKKEANLRYTLSEQIPIAFSGGNSSDIIQQLEIKNLGNAEATRIVIRIQGSVSSHQLQKYASSDIEQVFNGPPFEIIYPKLPPQAGIKLSIKSVSRGIGYNNLTISHDGGIAQEALSNNSKQSSLDIFTSFFLALAVCCLFFLIISSRKSFVESWIYQKGGS
jgi:hypothetical protein